VRRRNEWEAFHIAGAMHVPLARVSERLVTLDRDAEWTVVCTSGYRSMIAASVLERAGFHRVRNVRDGMDGWVDAGRPVESESPAASA
jgi:rhodanese-related sulfurtransferase